MNQARIAWALGATLVLAVPPHRAAAQDKAADGALTLEDVAVMLGSPERDEVQQAIEATAMLGDPAVVSLLRQRIAEGLPPDLLGSALDALGLLADPESAEIFIDLTWHRSTVIRVRAVQSLVMLGPEHATKARSSLERALSDSAPEVRAEAARGLGELGLQESVPLLFKAFELRVDHSGEALGKLARAEDLDRVLGYVGVYPLEGVLSIVLGLMERNDLPDKAKLRVVAQLQEVATAQARIALQRIAEMEADAVSARVRRAASEAANRISQ